MEPNNKISCFIRFLQNNYPRPNPSSLHSCAAHSAAKVREFINRNKITPEILCAKDNPFQMTPLHVAVLKKDTASAKLLVEKGASLTTQDACGNTPAHLAAMAGYDDLLVELRSLASRTNQQFDKIRNRNLATVATLENISKYPKANPNVKVAFLANSRGEVAPLTTADYQKLTGTVYTDRVVTSPELLANYWLKSGNSLPRDEFVEKIWDQYLQRRPKVYLEQQIAPESQIPLGLGVRTGEDLAAFTFLFPWDGELQSANIQEQSSDYKMDNIECARYGNEACRMNDGFPTGVLTKFNVEGCPDGIGVFTSEALAKDQMITIHYGVHPCKFGRYELLYREKLEQFCNRNRFEEIQRQAQPLLQKQPVKDYDSETGLKIATLLNPCLYILETPKALVHLITRNFLNHADLVFLESIVPSTTLIAKEGMPGIVNQFRKKMITLLSALEPLPVFKKDIFTVIDRLFSKHSVAVAMFTVQFLVNFPSLAEAFLKNQAEFDRQVQNSFLLAELLEKFLETAPLLVKSSRAIQEEGQAKLRAQRETLLRLLDKTLDPNLLPTLVRLIHNADICAATLNLFPPGSYPK